jgi:arylsulfatase A-like enzyme
VAARYGFHRGFDVYNNKNGAGIRRVLPPALRWLENNHDRPFFLFLHVFDCHCPYTPPRELKSLYSPDYRGTLDLKGKCGNPALNSLDLSPGDLAYIRQQYDGEVRGVDLRLQKLFDLIDEWGLDRNTLIVVLSDHGEEFMEHGQIGHQRSVYHELMWVPLIVRLPGANPRAGKIAERVELIDVMPTVLDLLGIAIPANLQGASFRALLEGRPGEWKVKPAYGELNELAVKRTVYRDDYQFIVNEDEGTEELYEIAADRGERDNLIGRSGEIAGGLKTLLRGWEERARREGERVQTGTITLDPKQREALKNLGYVE